MAIQNVIRFAIGSDNDQLSWSQTLNMWAGFYKYNAGWSVTLCDLMSEY